MNFLDKIQKDIQKGLKDGLNIIRTKAEKLTEEGKRKYTIFDLKSKVHRSFTELGAAAYAMKGTIKGLSTTAKTKAIIDKITKLESQLKKLEAPVKKTKTTKKKTARKSTKAKKA